MALPKVVTPTYKTTLPSTGETIEFRPFTVKEQKALLIAKESNDEEQMIRAVRDLISASVTGVDVNDLTLFDFEYLFLKTRAKSVGETADIKIKCKHCDHYTEMTLNIDDLQIDPQPKRGKDLAVTLFNDVGVVMRYPRFTSTLELFRSNANKSDAETTFDTIVNSIESVFDENGVYAADDHTREELVDFLDALDGLSLQKLTSFFNEMPVVSLAVNFRCTNEECKETNTETLRGLKNFF